MPFPFALWKPGTAVFDPATLSLSGWWRANYTGAPWAANASAGASGANGNLVTNLSDPTTGTAQNGYTPAAFAGASSQNLNNATLDSTFFSTTALTIIALAYAASAAAPTGSVYNDATVFRNVNSNQGLSFTTSGWTGYAYDGAYQSKAVACATGAYHLVMMRFDGANLGVTLDSAAEVTQACGTLTLGGDSANVGQAYGGATSFDGRILELMVSNTALSNGDYANVKSYVNTRYALAL